MKVVLTLEVPNELFDISDDKLKDIILKSGGYFDSIRVTNIKRGKVV